MHKFTLKARFILLLSTLLGIMLIGGIIIKVNNQEVSDLNQDISIKKISILNKAHALKLSIVQVQQWLTDISATRALDGLNDGFDEAKNNADLFRQLVSELTALDADTSGKYQAMLPVFENYYAAGQNMAKAYVKGGASAGNKLMADFDEAAAAMSGQVDEFLDSTISSTDLLLTRQSQLMSRNSSTMFIVFILLLISTIILYVIFIKALKFLGVISVSLNKISQGDLSGEIEAWCSDDDELAILCKSLGEMSINLTEIISGVRDSSNDLSVETKSMSDLLTSSMNMVKEQQTEIVDISDSMESMSGITHQVAENALTVVESAEQADINANKGKDVVNQVVSSIHDLSANIEDASHVIGKLEKHSVDIGGILDVIKGIAEQTNLLALNAAIEAARAGEQGRGFAVVADEVRTLASRTQESTSEIHNMIEKLQQGAKNAVDVMVKGIEQTDKSFEKAEEAVGALNEINNNIQSITKMNTKIAEDSTCQSDSAKKMAQRVISIKEVFEVTTNNSEKTVLASKKVDQLSEYLMHKVANFKL